MNAGKQGRPTNLTPELEAKILEKIRMGVPISLAAESCGVHRQSVHEWVRRGEGREDDRDDSEPFRSFAVAARQAAAEGAIFLHKHVLEAVIGSRPSRKKGEKKQVKSRMSPMRLGAAQWLLARRWPESYGSGRENGTIVDTSSDEEKTNLRPVIQVVYPDSMKAVIAAAEAEAEEDESGTDE